MGFTSPTAPAPNRKSALVAATAERGPSRRSPRSCAGSWALASALVLAAASTLLPACRRHPHGDHEGAPLRPTELRDPATVAADRAPERGRDPGGVRTKGGAAARSTPFGATRVHRTYASLGMTTERTDLHGTPTRVPCLVCHQSVEPKPENRFASELTDFHEHVQVQHGGQSCRTCHEVAAFDSYSLADGQRIAYHEVMKLCGQCHAQRKLEYEHGAHGGMTGYWDLDRGSRDRNHCLDCHNAHAPRVPQMQPAPRPRYRSGL